MLENLNLFQVAHALMRHSGSRQAVVSQNIANADTPGYAARDIAPFEAAINGDRMFTGMITTREGHLTGHSKQELAPVFEARDRSSNPNKNTVSLQEEMLFATEAKRHHDKALAIYKSGLRILRTSINK